MRLGRKRTEKKMRLINADKLREVMMITCLKEIDVDSPIDGMSIVLDRIYNAPTMDAVRMEKGEKNE